MGGIFDIRLPVCSGLFFFFFFECRTLLAIVSIGSFFFVISSHSTHLLAATTLRNVLGTKHLAEILSERETISHVMEQTLDEATDPWGVKVERVEM